MLGTHYPALERSLRIPVACTHILRDRLPLVTVSVGPRSGSASKEEASSAAMTKVIVLGHLFSVLPGSLAKPGIRR